MHIAKLAQMVLLAGTALLFGAAPGFAAPRTVCQSVGGGVLTNFVTAKKTLGTVTGDLSGAIEVNVLGVHGAVYHVGHRWVTASGDEIRLKDADLTVFPTSDQKRFLADYLDGAEVVGGTGRFAGATGSFPTIFGAVDLKEGLLTLRYAGTVCFLTVTG